MYNITLKDNTVFKINNSVENVAEKNLTLYFDPKKYSLETINKYFFNNDISDKLSKIIKTANDGSFIATFENYTRVKGISVEKVSVTVDIVEKIPTLNEEGEQIEIDVTVPTTEIVDLIVVRLDYENPIDLVVKNLNEQINPTIDYDKCTLDELKIWQKNKISNDCFKEIQNGVDVELSDKQSYHFSYKIEDQINYAEICQDIEYNKTETILYHPDGGNSTLYSVDDMKLIISAQRKNKLLLTTKCNSYYRMIDGADTKEAVMNITWGSELSSENQSLYNELISNLNNN